MAVNDNRITGILCGRFCQKVVLTDHNDEILKKNIELHSLPENSSPTPNGLEAEKLEWGNSDKINQILQKHPGGFDLILGSDIYIHNAFMSLSF
ncbi:protein N-lysine methyltransferase METTL21A [Senna tora]|uniref:Protein N-lysine methyltransferase METTL21A n=1 Tax=Senna tora TaxID=362788 RepID=A0A835CKW0_9FABA|nr:protein N-lysine methyltransferase METTL21A [Senna tora]